MRKSSPVKSDKPQQNHEQATQRLKVNHVPDLQELQWNLEFCHQISCYSQHIQNTWTDFYPFEWNRNVTYRCLISILVNLFSLLKDKQFILQFSIIVKTEVREYCKKNTSGESYFSWQPYQQKLVKVLLWGLIQDPHLD